MQKKIKKVSREGLAIYLFRGDIEGAPLIIKKRGAMLAAPRGLDTPLKR